MLKSAALIGILLTLCFYERTHSVCNPESCENEALRNRPPRNATELPEFCSGVTNASSCLDAVQCAPSDRQYDTWGNLKGDAAAKLYICSTEQVYRRFLHCQETHPALDATLSRCFSHLQSMSCRAINTTLWCVYDATKSACGQDLASYMVTYQQKALMKHITSLSCNISIGDDTSMTTDDGTTQSSITTTAGVGRTSSSVTSVMMLFIMALMFTRR